jgi:hypothetical protein
MALSAASAASAENEQIEKPKHELSHDRVETDVMRSNARWNRPLKQHDLSGFIGTDLWMVGKYER